MKSKHLLLVTTACAVLLPLQSAFADDVGEVIVTARKRQESVLKVPVVETVMSSAQIERAAIKDLADVSHRTVGLTLGVAATESGTQVSMRGYGTTALDPGIDSSVSLNLDGLQVTQGMAYGVGVFDMQQVEVLKGPQALFFGKASPAGVISIRTNDPGNKFEMIARTGYEFEAHESRNELILSGPVTDTLGARLAVMYDDMGGYFYNTGTPNPGTGAVGLDHRFGNTKTYFVRGTVVWKPTSEFSARLKMNYTRDHVAGAQAGQVVSCPEGTLNYLPGIGLPLPSFYSANENCKADRNVNIVGMSKTAFIGQELGEQPIAFTEQKFGTLELNYNLIPELTLTSVTGYYKLNSEVAFNCSFTGGNGPGCETEKHLSRQEFTEDLRITSDFSGPLNFTAGAFYEDGHIKDREKLFGNTALGLPPVLFDGSHDVPIRAYSGYGQLRYKPFPTLEIAAGARWTGEQRSDDTKNRDVFGAFGTPPGTLLNITVPKLSSHNWSPEFTVTWTPTDNLTLFGSYKQAFKSGSYNLTQPVNPTGPGFTGDNSFHDEKIKGGEIGMKGRFFDRQVRVNLAAYDYSVDGMQVGVSLPFNGSVPVLITLNAGSASIRGIEGDINYRPDQIPGLELFAAFNYNKARFTEFRDAPCEGGQTAAEGCNSVPLPASDPFALTDPNILGGAPFRYHGQDLSGTPLARAPDWSGSLGFHYERPVGKGMTLNFGGDVQMSSKYLTEQGRRDDFYQGGFAKFNANISLKGANDAWEVALIGNNLTDELTVNATSNADYAGGVVFSGATQFTGGSAPGPAGHTEVFGYLDRGREVWLRLTLRPTELMRGN